MPSSGLSLISAFETDRAAVRWIGPLRSALVCSLAVVLAVVFGEAEHATPLAMGALFAGMADPRGMLGVRSRSIAIVAVMNALAGAVGCLVADSYVMHVALAGMVGLFAGYLGVIGPRAATAGVLALVAFIVFSGTVYSPSDAPLVAVLLLAGALLQAVITLAPLLTRRLGGIRGDVSVAYRALALTFGRKHLETGSGSLAAKVALCRELIRESRVEGETLDWLNDLVETCERVRVGTFILDHDRSSVDDEGTEFLKAFFDSASSLCFAIASAVEIPLLKHRLAGKLSRVDTLLRDAPELPADTMASLDSIQGELERAVGLVLRKDWPIGAAAGVHFRFSAPHEDLSRLWVRNDTTTLFMRHAIRLSAVIALTTALVGIDGFEHSYWLPMTVAWVMKPDLAGSATRLTARLTGTLAGAFVFAGLYEVFGVGPVFTAVVVGASAFFVFAFIQANYALCTAGATTLFFTLVAFAGNPAISSAASRVGLTLIAGIFVAVAVLIVPARSIDLAWQRLADAAEKLADYVDAVRKAGRGDDLVRPRAEAALASITAGDVINAVSREPGDDGRTADSASRALEGLISATFFAVIREVSPDASGKVPLTDEGLARMRSVAEEAGALARGESPQDVPPDLEHPLNPFESAVAEAEDAMPGRT